MAIASLFLESFSILSPHPTKQRSSTHAKSFYCTTPSNALPTILPPLRLLWSRSVKPISASENMRFFNKKNWCDLTSSLWAGLDCDNPLVLQICEPTDEKFRCRFRKDDADEDIREGMETENSGSMKSCLKSDRNNNSQEESRKKLRSKIYKIVVVPAISISVALALCNFAFLPKLRQSPKVIPYSDLVVGIEEGYVTRVQFVENSRRIFFNTKSWSGEDDQLPLGNTLQAPVEDSNSDVVVEKQGFLANLLRKFSKSKEFGSTHGGNNDKGELVKKHASKPGWQYSTVNVDDDKYALLLSLKEKGVTYGTDPGFLSISAQNFLIALSSQSAYWVLVLLSCYQLSIQLSMGKSPARKPSKEKKVTFDDIEGVDDAKAELKEIVSLMKGDRNYKKLGAKLPRGVLLSGPPGTGKTQLARALAGEAGVSFFYISASELVEVFVGRGAARVRDLFRDARKHSPSIVFIDEIDAVGGQRGRTLNCERDQTLNQLLTEMDGFEKDDNLVIVAATNRPETLDSALLRPGRFSRKVVVPKPDMEGRRKIFAMYLNKIHMEEDKDIICNLVAAFTPGLVGADLQYIAQEAVRLACRRGGESVSRGDVLEAVERVKSEISIEGPGQEGPKPEDDGGVLGFGTLG